MKMEKQFRSHARWLGCSDVYTRFNGNHVSTDDHYSEEEAIKACLSLERDGFGGDGKCFPVETWVTPIPFEEQFPEAGEALSAICKERGKERSKGKRLKPLFLDATEPVKAEEKAGRNDPCPCGSGRKYKKCCLR